MRVRTGIERQDHVGAWAPHAFATTLAPEYGRTYTETFGLTLSDAELLRIAHSQCALAQAARRNAQRIVVEDTDPVLTAVWSDVLLGARDPWFAAFDDYADLYLLCTADFGRVDDGTLFLPIPPAASGSPRRARRNSMRAAFAMSW